MKKIIIFILVTFLFAGKCEKKLFTFHLKEPIKFKEILSDLSNECDLNLIIEDGKAERIIDSDLNFVNIDKVSLKKFLDVIFDVKHLFYKLKGNNLYISYYKTKTFKLDFIPNSISGTANVNTDNNSIKTNYQFNFWRNLKNNLIKILSNVDKNYKKPVIDKNTGLITVTANRIQMERIKNYLKELNNRLHKEVLIDVRIYSVDLSSSHKTGIDWSTFSLGINGNLQISASRDYTHNENVALNNSSYISTLNKTGDITRKNSALISSNFNINGLINFLAQNGNVNSISNPKIVTLNNQKALIRLGETIYYKYANSATTDNNGNAVTSYTIDSKFVGIVLDITPQISDDNTVILNINPRISEFKDESQLQDVNRDRPPDTKESSLMSVVRMKSDQTLILGGLITNNSSLVVKGIPILKEIPIIKYLFSSTEKVTSKKELVFVITPHIINLNNRMRLEDYGYRNLKEKKWLKK